MRFADYLRRIGQPPPCDASLETLRRLHLAHREAFLFENLTIQAGGAISTEVADIERKFRDEGRGRRPRAPWRLRFWWRNGRNAV